jgi:hypothetical protein
MRNSQSLAEVPLKQEPANSLVVEVKSAAYLYVLFPTNNHNCSVQLSHHFLSEVVQYVLCLWHGLVWACP